MHASFSRLLVVAGVVGAGLFAVVPEAHAAKIPIVYNSGEEFFEAGELPAPYNTAPELAGAKAGFICNIQGVLWAYFSISDCRHAAVRGETYFDDAALVAAIKAAYPTEESMKVGFWNKHGIWFVGLGVLGILGGGALSKVLGKK